MSVQIMIIKREDKFKKKLSKSFHNKGDFVVCQEHFKFLNDGR